MKKFSLYEGTHGMALRTRMVLLFMAALAGMFSITAINLFLAKEGMNGGLTNSQIIVLATIVAVGLIAFCTFIVTISITRPLRAIFEFTRSISNGRLDGHLAVTGSREAVALAGTLNAMAKTFQARVAKMNSVADVLASIDDTLENASSQLINSAGQYGSSIERTTAMVETIRESIKRATGNVECLASSINITDTTIHTMAFGIENVTANASKLEKSFTEIDSSVTEMAETGKRIDTGIINLLDASFETASSIAEMDASIRRVKKNARDASSISEGVKSDAATGKRAVEESIAGMRAIRNSSAITAEVVENLSLRVKDIGTILLVIDEVAEQTNLLALNATIIAAQAGEQGKGFAVVASDIRELAERTSSSTREIASVIRGVQDETRRAVDAINLAEISISEGEKLSQHSGTALEKIVVGVEQASIQVNEIARATVEQAHGSQIIREAMERITEQIENIVTSDGEQTETCQRIFTAIEQMKTLASDIRSSLITSGESFNLLNHANAEISDTIELVRESGRSQLQSCAMLSRTLGNSRSAASNGTLAAKTMGDTAIDLSKQVNLLEKELTGFIV